MDAGTQPPSLWSSLRIASRFWEAWRLRYNIVLSIIGAVWFALGWRSLLGVFKLPDVGALAVLAIFANLCYCAAYIPDVAMQSVLAPEVCERWRRRLWFGGTFLAALAESYWINDEILSGP